MIQVVRNIWSVRDLRKRVLFAGGGFIPALGDLAVLQDQKCGALFLDL